MTSPAMKKDRPPARPDKIFFAPNLMTAGNLICGFLAVLRLVQGTIDRSSGADGWVQIYESSLYFILAACIFDLLDGQVARRTGGESAFGREFDSLADVVSFGVAPALMIFEIVLRELPNRIGWLLAAFYLMCGTLRLARFNVHATMAGTGGGKEFTGFPIPAAAGTVSSITLLMLHYYETDRELEQGWGKYLLAALLFFLSLMMFSQFKYPSFKGGFNLRAQRSIGKFAVVGAVLALTIIYYQFMLAVVFVSYLLYGFLRPFVSRAWRREIEADADDEDDEDEDEASGLPS